MIINPPKKNRLNEAIKAPYVRLVDAEGNQVGIVEIKQALAIAQEAKLDLVEISSDSEPPVCKIMDFHKFQFKQNKSRSVSKKTHLKELKFSIRIEANDFLVKTKKLIGFLQAKHKVKITLRFKGREVAHPELGYELLARLQVEIELYGIVEQVPKLEGRQLTMVIAPKSKKSNIRKEEP